MRALVGGLCGKRDHFVPDHALRRLVRRYIGFDDLADAGTPLYVVAFDLAAGTEVPPSIALHARASCCRGSRHRRARRLPPSGNDRRTTSTIRIYLDWCCIYCVRMAKHLV